MKRIPSLLLCILLLAALPLSAAGAQSSAAEKRDTGLYLLTPKTPLCITNTLANCPEPCDSTDGIDPDFFDSASFSKAALNRSFSSQWVWSGNDTSLWGQPFTPWNTADVSNASVPYFSVHIEKENCAKSVLTFTLLPPNKQREYYLLVRYPKNYDSSVPSFYLSINADWVNELALFPNLGPENPLVPVRSAAGLAVISLDGTVLRALYIEPNHCTEEVEESARQFLSKQKAQLKKDGQCVAINIPLSKKALCNPYNGTPVSKAMNDELNDLLRYRGYRYDDFSFYSSTPGAKKGAFYAMDTIPIEGGECVFFAYAGLYNGRKDEQNPDYARVEVYVYTETKSLWLMNGHMLPTVTAARNAALGALDLERFETALMENTVDFAKNPDEFSVQPMYSFLWEHLRFRLDGWDSADALFYTGVRLTFEKSTSNSSEQSLPNATLFSVARYEPGMRSEDVKPVYYLTVDVTPADAESPVSSYYNSGHLPVYATRFYLGSSISLKKVLSLIRTANSIGEQG